MSLLKIKYLEQKRLLSVGGFLFSLYERVETQIASVPAKVLNLIIFVSKVISQRSLAEQKLQTFERIKGDR